MKNKLPPVLFLTAFALMLVNYSIAQKIIPNIVVEPNQETENFLPPFDCEGSTAQTDLDVNNVRARLQVAGDLWWDGNDASYIVPQPTNGEPEVSAIFAGGLWMGGFDPGGSLKMAAQSYGRSNGSFDYWPGPLDDIGTTTESQCEDFDRFWNVTSVDINNHIADWDDNGMIDGPVPNSILGWAGAGNPNSLSVNGFELPDSPQGLAPFYDRNNNGIYEPMLGDSPQIKDADQGTWWVFNDAGNIHTQSGGDVIQMELQVLAYAYESADENINNATFYDYKIINQAIESIDSFYIGLWVDFDLGCYTDDYLGCDPEQDLVYVYNSDALDGNSSCTDCQGVNTYCEDIPIVGIKLLEGPLASKVFVIADDGTISLRNPYIGEIGDTLVELGLSNFMAYNGGNSNPPPPPGTTDPTNTIQMYNLLSGSWPDGTRLIYGGDGYDPLSTDYTNYAFPNPPDDPDGWSMCSENLFQGDRKAVMSCGPFQALPGSVNTFSFAVIYVDGIAYPCPDLSPLNEACAAVNQHFEDNTVSIKESIARVSANIQFQPNPMRNQAELVFKELENKVLQVGIFSIDGKKLQTYSNINGSSLTIERGDLNPGIYFYKLLTEDYKIHSGKFIVQ